jgi:hypothetical protein
MGESEVLGATIEIALTRSHVHSGASLQTIPVQEAPNYRRASRKATLPHAH